MGNVISFQSRVGRMEDWQKHIREGNRLFAQRAYNAAIEEYRRALKRSELLFHVWENRDEAVSAFVVSHHNYADLYIEMGIPQIAGRHLEVAHEFLLNVMNDPETDVELRRAAMRGSRKTYKELLCFLKKAGCKELACECAQNFYDATIGCDIQPH